MAGGLTGEVFGEKEKVSGTLGESAHEIGIPGVAVRDVEPQGEAAGDKFGLKVAADAVEHLKFEAVGGEFLFLDEADGLAEDIFVVAGDGRVGSFGEKELHELEVVGVDVGLAGEGEVRWFAVSALTEADRNGERGESTDIGFAAEEIGLNDGPDAARVRGLEIFDEPEGTVSEGSGLHVDLDAAVHFARAVEQAGDVGAAGGLGKGEAELGELDRDGSGEIGALDGVLGFEIGNFRLAGFVDRGDAFAKEIEGGLDSFAGEMFEDADAFFESLTGDEASGEAAGERGVFHPVTQPALFGKVEDGVAEHDNFSTGCWRRVSGARRCRTLTNISGEKREGVSDTSWGANSIVAFGFVACFEKLSGQFQSQLSTCPLLLRRDNRQSHFLYGA